MNEALLASVFWFGSGNWCFLLGALKALGLDGFNGLFFQKNLGVLKEDITDTKAVINFFYTGYLKEDVNVTIVALVPKVPINAWVYLTIKTY